MCPYYYQFISYLSNHITVGDQSVLVLVGDQAMWLAHCGGRREAVDYTVGLQARWERTS